MKTNFGDELDLLLEDWQNNTPLSQEQIILKVRERILQGGSKLAVPLASGEVTLADCVKCITRERCLCMKERDLGSSYLEQVISTALRDIVPVNQLNMARPLFGLEPLPDSKLVDMWQKQQIRLRNEKNNP